MRRRREPADAGALPSATIEACHSLRLSSSQPDATHALDGLSQLSNEEPIAALAEYRILHGQIARQSAAAIAAARKAGHDDAAVRIALGMEDTEKYPDDVAHWLAVNHGILINGE